jgi:LCP family protein required for cell wall assembly
MKDNRYYYDTQTGKRKRRHGALHVFMIVLLVILALGLAGIVFVKMHMGSVGHITSSEGTSSGDTGLQTGLTGSSDIRNILLVGTDKRADWDNSRSDSMILCSLNLKTGKVTLISLMRDMYLAIPGYGSNRLNAAYAYGGLPLLDQTIEQNFGVRIDHTAEVDLDGFLSAMTAVGNLDIDINAQDAKYLNNNTGYGSDNDTSLGTWNLHEGVNSLTPEQSLAYCRIRYVGNSDWERTERQRKVLTAAFSKLKSSDPVTQYKVVSKVLPCLTTDMNDAQMLSYGIRLALGGGSLDAGGRIPADGTYKEETIDGMDVLVPDIAANSTALKNYIYGTN